MTCSDRPHYLEPYEPSRPISPRLGICLKNVKGIGRELQLARLLGVAGWNAVAVRVEGATWWTGRGREGPQSLFIEG